MSAPSMMYEQRREWRLGRVSSGTETGGKSRYEERVSNGTRETRRRRTRRARADVISSPKGEKIHLPRLCIPHVDPAPVVTAGICPLLLPGCGYTETYQALESLVILIRNAISITSQKPHISLTYPSNTQNRHHVDIQRDHPLLSHRQTNMPIASELPELTNLTKKALQQVPADVQRQDRSSRSRIPSSPSILHRTSFVRPSRLPLLQTTD